MRSERRREEFEGSQGALGLGDIVKSRIRLKGDLKVEIRRMLFAPYFNFFPDFNFIFWLI